MNNQGNYPPRWNVVRRSFVLNSAQLGQRTATGAGYKIMGIALRTAITIASTASLARLLSPADFGYIAMASVVTEFAALFGAFGFTNVLIQRPVINRLQLDTVFWATLAVGTVLSLAVFGLSFISQWVFADAQVAPLLRVMSLAFILNSLSAVPWIVMSRQLQFGAEFWAQLGGAAIRTLAAVVCAIAGLGVWSLVIGGLVGTLCSVIINFIFVPYLPRFRFHLPLLTATWRTSSGYFGSNALYFLNTNLDLLLIGRQLGAVSLGYYQNSRSLTDEIRARLAMPIQHVLFPAFSAVQNEQERFQQLVMRAGRLLAAIVIPVGFGVSANATELVLVLYGGQWRPMITIMSMFGLSAAVRAATAIASPVFNSNNRVGLALRYNAIGTVLMVGAVLLAIPHGIDAVAIAVAVSSLYPLVSFRAAFALIGLDTRHMAQVLGLPLVAALVMWLATFGLRQLTHAWIAQPAALLLVHVGVGGTVYLVTLHLLSRQYWIDFNQALARLLKRS